MESYPPDEPKEASTTAEPESDGVNVKPDRADTALKTMTMATATTSLFIEYGLRMFPDNNAQCYFVICGHWRIVKLG